MKPRISTLQHYERLAGRGHWHHESPETLRYMARWDGQPFFSLIGDTTNKDILEVGIGNGRIARQILNKGCKSYAGLDISSKIIAIAKSNLDSYKNVELIHDDVTAFDRKDRFDIAYSVLTFMHIQDKKKALQNIINALRPGGYFVLSIDHAPDWLDFGEWRVRLYPWAPNRYIDTLLDLGFTVNDVVPLTDQWVGQKGEKFDTYGTTFATLIKASKPSPSYKERCQ